MQSKKKDEISELDYEGALIWVECPLCGAERKMACFAVYVGPTLFGRPEEGKVHDLRMQKWLEFKERVIAGSKMSRNPNMQQIPRSEPHVVSEGGDEEARIYWENRNKLRPKR